MNMVLSSMPTKITGHVRIPCAIGSLGEKVGSLIQVVESEHTYKNTRGKRAKKNEGESGDEGRKMREIRVAPIAADMSAGVTAGVK